MTDTTVVAFEEVDDEWIELTTDEDGLPGYLVLKSVLLEGLGVEGDGDGINKLLEGRVPFSCTMIKNKDKIKSFALMY